MSLELKGTMVTEEDGMEEYMQQSLDNQKGQTGSLDPEAMGMTLRSGRTLET